MISHDRPAEVLTVSRVGLLMPMFPGKGAALVRVENLGPAMLCQRLLERFNAECRLHRDRYAMGRDPSAEHIDNRCEVDEATPHPNIGDVHRPRLVGPLDLQPQ